MWTLLSVFTFVILLHRVNSSIYSPQENLLSNNVNHSRGKHSIISDCIQCICKVESDRQASGCEMDGGSLSCGYFQIKQDYYTDCSTPGRQSGEDIIVAWKKCAADYSCSVQCVNNYVNRYGSGCAVANQCEKWPVYIMEDRRAVGNKQLCPIGTKLINASRNSLNSY